MNKKQAQTPLDYNTAWDRSIALSEIETLGNYFVRLSNAAYEASRRVESREGEYARDPIDAETLATKTAHDVAVGVAQLHHVSESFHKAVANAMPAIETRVETMVIDRVKDGKFCGNGHHVRQNIAANVCDVVGEKLGL